jgi:tetratricopeptide (TPR) repeat protein
MHYEFPADFTTDRVAIHGGSVLSAEDRRFVAEIYPGRGTSKPKTKLRPLPKMKHYSQRRILLRNDTAVPLVMDVAVERSNKGAWKWTAADPKDGKSFAVAAGGQLLLPTSLAGRAARVRARSTDGKQVWSDHVDPAVVLSDAGGYDDRTIQSLVIATSGQPDAPASADRDTLWNRAHADLDAGKWAAAQESFNDFAARFPADPWVPWAKLYVVTAQLGQGQVSDAAYAAYQLIVDHPDADASRYAWYYGGVAAMERGACDDAKAYFEVAGASDSGLPAEWIETAKDYLRQIDQQRDTWCA